MSERVASRIVSRFLQRFVRTVEGEEVAAVRVALQQGALVLHNLDLNLSGAWPELFAATAPRRLTAGASRKAFVPAGGATTVERAFAQELRISVPWSSLGTDPLEVRANSSATTPRLCMRMTGSHCS